MTNVFMACSHRRRARSATAETRHAHEQLPSSNTKKVVNQALTRLVAEGFVAESRGGRGRTRTLRLVQPFTEGGIVARPYDAGALFDGGVFDEPEHIADAEYRASLHNLDDYR